ARKPLWRKERRGDEGARRRIGRAGLRPVPAPSAAALALRAISCRRRRILPARRARPLGPCAAAAAARAFARGLSWSCAAAWIRRGPDRTDRRFRGCPVG